MLRNCMVREKLMGFEAKGLVAIEMFTESVPQPENVAMWRVWLRSRRVVSTDLLSLPILAITPQDDFPS